MMSEPLNPNKDQMISSFDEYLKRYSSVKTNEASDSQRDVAVAAETKRMAENTLSIFASALH